MKNEIQPNLIKPLAMRYSARDSNYARKLLSWFLAPPPEDSPSEFAVKEIRFDYSRELRGPFDFTGRHYLRRPIDDAARPEVRKQTKVFGRGNGKTSCDEVQICYKLKYQPGTRGLSAWPSTQGEGSSEDFAGNRLGKTIKATPSLASLVPSGGQERYVLNKKKIAINGSHYGFIGAHSGGKGVGNRLTDIYFDEIEKYPPTLKNEGSVINLAEGSVEGVTDYQIHYSSTPVLEDGLIWKQIQKSNLHLYFLPCPHCQRDAGLEKLKTEEERAARAVADHFKGWFIILFSHDYSAGWPTKFQTANPELATLNGQTIPAATVHFRYAEGSTKEKPLGDAKNLDGTWNVHQAARNARIECPHCQQSVSDTEPQADGTLKIVPDRKVWMDEHGAWICVKPGEPNHIGYMINSLYAPVINDESTWGGRVQKFLAAIEEGSEAVKTFVNAILAGVYTSQDTTSGTGIEISQVVNRVASNFYWPELSGDRQAKYPGFWYRVRRWLISNLRPVRSAEEQSAFFANLPTEHKLLVDRLAPPPRAKEPSLYSPAWIVAQIQRTDHWPAFADWLIANSRTGAQLTEFYQIEFQGDLIRLLEFIADPKRANVPFGRQGDSECLEAGSADAWEEIDDAQRRYNIAGPDVIVDARFGSMDNAEVFAECFRRCPPQGFCYYSPVITPFGPRGKFSKTPMPGYRPFAERGWTPVLGYPEHKVWPGKDKIRLPYTQEVNDPFVGKMEARQYYQYVFKFDAQWALSELARIRKRNAWTLSPEIKFVGHNAEMRPVTLQDYNLHLKGYFWNERDNCWVAPGKAGGSQSRRHPNHLYDCEKNGLARAIWKGIFKYQREK